MGNKSSAEKSKSKKLSMHLAAAKRKDETQIKLLLLGAGESGKSTIFKQMKFLYGAGFTDIERKKMKPFLVSNVVEGAIDIYMAAPSLSVEFNDQVKQAGELLIGLTDKRSFTDEIVNAISTMWADEDFKGMFLEKRSKFQVQENWGDFADMLEKYPDEWGGPNWIPSTDEILKCRVRTTGIVDEEFTVKTVKLRMLDVGGQRNERRKWIHCFEGVTSVLFVASLSEYDQTLFEDSTQNRLKESLTLFTEISNSEWFVKSAIVLFLNKTDLFQEKFCIKKVPLNASGLFDDAPESEDLEEAYAWFEQKFRSCMKDKTRELFIHRTCATDTSSLDVVMDACFQHILAENLKQISYLG